MNKFFWIFLAFLPGLLIAQNKLGFVNENIDFSINSETFSVNGIYSFANNTENEIRQFIFFPFSEKSDSIVVIRVYNLTYNENLPFQKVENGITFKINLLPKDTINVNISYNQKTEKENIYILESTQTWGKPLQAANYSLTFDESVKIDSLSLKSDTLVDNTYYWEKHNFYPKENFRVWIK